MKRGKKSLLNHREVLTVLHFACDCALTDGVFTHSLGSNNVAVAASTICTG